MSREDVMREAGIGLSTIKRVESNEAGPNRATLLLLAKALKLDPPEALVAFAAGELSEKEFMDQLEARDGSKPWKSVEEFLASRGLKPMEPVARRASLPLAEFMVVDPERGTPVLGEVTAGGMPIIYPGKQRVYALRIRGDSMAPEYRPGDVLVVQDAIRDELGDQEDAVIQCDGGADGCSTFKRAVFLGDGVVRLEPLNAAYKAVEIKFEHIVRIGKVLATVRPNPALSRG